MRVQRCRETLPWQPFLGFLYMRCTLASPGEYDWTVHVRQRCGLMLNYFDQLLPMTLTDCWRSQPFRQTDGRTVTRSEHIQYHYNRITINTGVASDGNVLVMSTIVSTPAVVQTVEKMSFWSSTRYIVQPDGSCSRTISVSQWPSNVPKG